METRCSSSTTLRHSNTSYILPKKKKDRHSEPSRGCGWCCPTSRGGVARRGHRPSTRWSDPKQSRSAHDRGWRIGRGGWKPGLQPRNRSSCIENYFVSLKKENSSIAMVEYLPTNKASTKMHGRSFSSFKEIRRVELSLRRRIVTPTARVRVRVTAAA